MGRHDRSRHIETLDPERDFREIHQLTSSYEFPWDTARALELALYRTFCDPGIARVLDASGEFRHRPQKRYDDTALLLGEIFEHGVDSVRGRSALRRVNRMHAAHSAITNEQMLYVLSTFVFVPIRWLDRFGWRPMTRTERLGTFYAYRELGRHMGIRDIPSSYDEFEAFHDHYEQVHFRYDDANRRTGEATRELFVSWFPWLPGSLVRASVTALLDDRMREAFGFEPPPTWLTAVVESGLRMRARAVRLMPPRRRAFFPRMSRLVRGYPKGYRVEELGTFPQEGAARVERPATR
jgi:hypothetical protein